MIKIRLFFILLIFLSVGCEEEEEKISLLGKWQVTWIVEEETLSGQLNFFADSALLIVNGHENSLLVQQPTEINYTWNLSANSLILRPMEEEFSMEYHIIQASPDQWTLRCLDEITLKLSR